MDSLCYLQGKSKTGHGLEKKRINVYPMKRKRKNEQKNFYSLVFVVITNMDVASTMVEDTCQLYLSCETVEILSVVGRRKEISTFLRITRKMSNGKKEKK